LEDSFFLRLPIAHLGFASLPARSFGTLSFHFTS
jgi:hypothetical protein